MGAGRLVRRLGGLWGGVRLPKANSVELGNVYGGGAVGRREIFM